MVMPAFNEPDALELVVHELLAEVNRLPDPGLIRILIVDDGSTDATLETALRLAASEPQVSVVEHDQNRGLGAAVRTGLGHTRPRYAMMIPADGQWNPEELPLFVAAAHDGVALALGVRDAREVYGVSRRLLSSVYALLVGLLFRTSCRDFAWVHLYDLSIAPWSDVEAHSPFFPVEVALRTTVVTNGAVRQIPSTMRERQAGITKVATARVITRMVRELLSASWRIRYRPRFRHARPKSAPSL
jgi:glycosyltransferase involved in cell wall biosynthesis